MSTISYVFLRKIQQAEKNSSALTKIDKDFYKDITEFLFNLNKRLIDEKSPKKQLLIREELQRIEKVAANIYEQRERKIVIAAMTKSRGGNPNIKNLIEEEEKLFHEIYNILIFTRKSILERETESKKEENVEIEETYEDENKIIDESKTVSKSEDHKDSSTLERKYIRHMNTNPIVRILEDIPSFVGLNKKTYHLKKGDIVSLPPDIYEALIKKNVAKDIISSLIKKI